MENHDDVIELMWDWLRRLGIGIMMRKGRAAQGSDSPQTWPAWAAGSSSDFQVVREAFQFVYFMRNCQNGIYNIGLKAPMK